MNDKETIKEEIKRKIENIEIFGEKFITYLASLHKDFLNEVLECIEDKEQKLDKIKEYCNNCNLKADFTACDVLQIIEGKENE